MTIVDEMMTRHAAGEMKRPCDDAVEWLGDETDWQRAWDRCPMGEWMLWAAHEYGHEPPRDWTAREIVSYAMGYAADALDWAGLDDHAATLRRHQDALRTATADDVVERLTAAWDAARAAARAATRAAALAAANATRAAAWGAALAAANAAMAATWDAAWDAANAAWDAGDDAERKRCADAVRKLWPSPPWLEGSR
jgi:hypothetical protein